MRCNWKECTLGDLITFQRGHDLPKSKMIDGKYPVVGSNGIIGYHNEYTTEFPSITIGRSGNVGNPFIVYGQTWSHNTTLYVKDFKGNDPVFVYYFLKTMDLANYAGGSAVPTLNRNHIHTLLIKVPESVRVQKKIGYYLRLLDEKIELNNAINNNLPPHLCVARIAATQRKQIPKTDGCLHTDGEVSGRGGNLKAPQVFSSLRAA